MSRHLRGHRLHVLLGLLVLSGANYGRGRASAQEANSDRSSGPNVGQPVAAVTTDGANSAPQRALDSDAERNQPGDTDEAGGNRAPDVPDAELSAFLSDAAEATSESPSFKIYGFADVNVGRPYLAKQNPVSAIADKSIFAVGNVNLYLASNLTHGFSSLVEVRMTYMPSGSFDPTGKVTTTYASDPASYGRYDTWGGIILQRVHLDYSYNSLLNVRVGQFLTPYGIWNVDHGSPTVISIVRPYPIGNAYFPDRQVGLELFGSHLIKNVTLGYHLTVSNGRGDVPTADFDKNKALGGRLFLAT